MSLSLLDDLDTTLALAPLRPLGRKKQRDYTPAEEDSLLRRIGNAGLSGLSMVGNLLDVPGSMVRDLATGNNPFDQLLPWNWTNSDNRATGRDVLHHYGLSSQNDPNKWEAADFGGFGAEVLMDPLTYLTFGGSALTKAGKSAKLAGTSTKGVGAGIRAGERGLAKFKIPFTDVGETVLGTGPAAARFGDALDTGVSWLANKNPVGLHAQGLMNAAAKGVTHQDIQPLAKNLHAQQADIATKARGDTARWMQTLDDAGLNTPQHIDEIRQVVEGQASALHPAMRSVTDEMRAMDDAFQAQRHGTALSDPAGAQHLFRAGVGFDKRGQGAGSIFDAAEGSNIQRSDPLTGILGGTVPLVRNIIQDPKIRSIAATPKEVEKYVRRSFKIAKNDPDYATKIKQVLDTDPSIPQLVSDKKAGRYVYKAHGDMLVPKPEVLLRRLEGWLANPPQNLNPNVLAATQHPTVLTALASNTPLDALDALKQVDQSAFDALARPSIKSHANSLAKTVRNLSDEQAGYGLFGNSPLHDFETYAISRGTAQAREANALEGISMFAGKGQPGGTTVGEMLQGLHIHPGDALSGPIADIAAKVGIPVDPTNPRLLKRVEKRVRNLPLPDDVAKALGQGFETYKTPTAASPLLTLSDSLTNMFKAGVLSWPSRLVRDRVSGSVMNWVTGNASFQAEKYAKALMKGEDIADAGKIPEVARMLQAQGLPDTPKNATDMLRQMTYAYERIGSRQGAHGSAAVTGFAGQGGPITHEMMQQEMIGQNPTTWTGVLQKLFTGKGIPGGGKNPLNPLNMGEVRGVANKWGTGEVRTKSLNRAVAAAEDAGYITDSMNRMVPFLKNLMDGASPKVASEIADKLQVSYHPRNYSKTEQQVLKRLVPFYSFSSRMTPAVAGELLQRPGGGLAQTIRAENRMRGEDPSLPEQIQESLSIPLGQNSDGSKKFLTGFGLMHEDPLSLLSSPGLETLSRMNPLIKGPLEYFTGHSFHQRGPDGGAPLESLDPTIGRIIANVTGEKDASPVLGSQFIESAAANSPVSRLLTSLRTLTETPERKGVGSKAANLLSGFRITDVSPQKQDRVIRELLDQQMKEAGGRAYNKVYFSKEEKAALPPAERAAVESMEALQKMLAKRAKDRKEAAARH
jgi:hypothetical protein